MRVLRVSIGVGAVLFFALACGGGGTATNAPATGSTATLPADGELPVTCGAPTTATQTNVSIANLAYDPASVTVAPGAIVQWTNNDSTAHTVTFDNSLVSGLEQSEGNTDVQAPIRLIPAPIAVVF